MCTVLSKQNLGNFLMGLRGRFIYFQFPLNVMAIILLILLLKILILPKLISREDSITNSEYLEAFEMAFKFDEVTMRGTADAAMLLYLGRDDDSHCGTAYSSDAIR